jgi:hypothetical protein
MSVQRDVPPTDKKGTVEVGVAILLPRKPFFLGKGCHSYLADGACFNELGSVLAGESWSASPKCYSPLISRMGMMLNDRLDDEPRQLLRPFALRALGTAGDGRDEERRQMCSEWLLHEMLPRLLDAAACQEAAHRLRDLPADVTVEGVSRAIREARDEAQSARTAAVATLKKRILAEMKKRNLPAAAVAVVDAVADVAAVAAADAVVAAAAAAVAVAVVDAVADVAAVAAADAVVAAAAAADVAAAAAAAADAVAVAVAGLTPGDYLRYGEVYWAVREALQEKVAEKLNEIMDPVSWDVLGSALDLMDRMLPASPLQAPVIDYAEIVCAAPESAAA